MVIRVSVKYALIVSMLSMLFFSGTVCADVVITVSPDASKVSIRCEAAVLEEVLEALHKEAGITYQCPNKLLNYPIESNVTMMPFMKALNRLFSPFNTAFISQDGKVIHVTIINESTEVNAALYLKPPIGIKRAAHHKSKKSKKDKKRIKKDYTWQVGKIRKMQKHLVEKEANGEDTSRLRERIRMKMLQLDSEVNVGIVKH